MDIYVIRTSPYNESWITNGYATNEQELISLVRHNIIGMYNNVIADTVNVRHNRRDHTLTATWNEDSSLIFHYKMIPKHAC